MSQLQKLAIIGDPISHSLSPAMQQAAIDAAGLNATYEARHVRDSELALFVQQARHELLGFNVTVPHKVAIMPLLDHITPDATAIGAVNTVKNESGRLIGYNTDAAGFIEGLWREKNFEPKGRSATVLGAGGAARAVVYGLLQAGVHQIFLSNRTLAKSGLIRDDFEKIFSGRVILVPFRNQDLATCFKLSSLFVNASSLGMPGMPLPELPLDDLPASTLISDLVYKPRCTALLQTAQKIGQSTQDGLDMLLYQGALAFEIWFEQKPDVTVMRRALEAKLT